MADAFLRRFKKRHFENGVISPLAFECRLDETGLSFHIRRPPLDTDDGVGEYQLQFAYEKSGDLPGVCSCGDICFGGTGPPQLKRLAETQPFANLHCELEPCPDADQRAHIARMAVMLRTYEKRS